MNFGEALAQAFKLFVLVVSYAIDEAKKKQARIEDWRARRDVFERMVSQAMIELRLRAELESKQVASADDAIDKAREEKPPHGKTVDRVDDLQQRADDSGGSGKASGDDSTR